MKQLQHKIKLNTEEGRNGGEEDNKDNKVADKYDVRVGEKKEEVVVGEKDGGVQYNDEQ